MKQKKFPQHTLNAHTHYNGRLQSYLELTDAARGDLERSTQSFRRANDRLEANLNRAPKA